MTKRRIVATIAACLTAACVACAHATPEPAVSGPATLEPATPAAPGLKAMRVNGTVLNYVDTVQAGASDAARPPIVLVHGTLGYLGEWRNQVAAFSARRRTVSYSRRYHVPNPRADDGEARYTPGLHAADLAALIRALRLGPVDLVGSSYGGAVAIAFAREHPELVHALVLAEPAVNLYSTPAAEDSVRRFAAASTSGLDSARSRFARGDSIGGLRALVDATMAPGAFDAIPAGERGYFISQMYELRKEMLTPADAWLPRLTCADLRPLTMPVLVLIGERTLPIYHSINEHVSACVPGSHTATIPAVGHHLVENSPAFNAEVLRFLDGVRR